MGGLAAPRSVNPLFHHHLRQDSFRYSFADLGLVRSVLEAPLGLNPPVRLHSFFCSGQSNENEKLMAVLKLNLGKVSAKLLVLRLTSKRKHEVYVAVCTQADQIIFQTRHEVSTVSDLKDRTRVPCKSLLSLGPTLFSSVV